MLKSEYKSLAKQAQKLQLDDAARETLDGEFIKLPGAVTHYQLKGEGESVVLVHGYATPYYIYDKLFEALVYAGFKVLRYDLLGRGYSERVKGDYSPSLFVKQLSELVDSVLNGEKFYLVGTSMGGAITAAYCAKHPDRVKKLILLAPAGMDTFNPPFYMKICKIPLLGDAMFKMVGCGTLLKKCASELKNVDESEKDYYERKFAESFRYDGFLRCTLSSLRHTILKTDETVKGYRSVASSKIPVLCIWGKEDKTMPYSQHTRLLETCPQTELITYENSGHIFVFDEGTKTAKDVIAFIKK